MSSSLNSKARFSYGLDLGSNTLRGVILDCKSGEFILSHESIVRTAEGIAKSGKISGETLSRVITAIEEGKGVISKIDIDSLSVRAVATEALRGAKNRDEVLKEIEKTTGIRFEIIDGYEEAKLTMEAVRYRVSKLGIDSSNIIAVDIGGGSTEVSIYSEGNFRAESFKVGILTLSQKYKGIEEMKEALRGELRGLNEFVSSIDKDLIDSAIFVVTAGTPTTVAALREGMDYESYEPSRINGIVLSIDDIQSVYAKLKSMPSTELSRAVGRGREDLIPVGVEILLKIYEIFKKSRAIVIDDGLREGVAIELCNG